VAGRESVSIEEIEEALGFDEVLGFIGFHFVINPQPLGLHRSRGANPTHTTSSPLAG